MTEIKKPQLETIVGELRETLLQVIPETVQHSAEIKKQQREDHNLTEIWFWVADLAFYGTEKVGDEDEPFIYLAKIENNLYFQDIENLTVRRFKDYYSYTLRPEEKQRAIKASSTLRIPLSELRLQNYGVESSYFSIDTKNYDKELNYYQRAFAERVYGAGGDS